jgi:hypothetical protein
VSSDPAELLLACRTHYLRTARDEVGQFTGQDRQGPTGRDYLALLMLPFSDEQIRQRRTRQHRADLGRHHQ